ncbi:MAG: ferritin-like domain-containing protein [Xanthomonadales bacterium]|nr:ferritin-like domain-containing protein [Xanthomonadales bacterium]
MNSPSLQAEALGTLMARDPEEKARRVTDLMHRFSAGVLPCAHPAESRLVTIPGRPDRPRLVAPGRLEKRGLGSARGRACLVHAVAHIEFNAINLALDAVYRFAGLPQAFYADWLSVAVDEARHFRLLADRLLQLGYRYGDFPAHNGLWEMALKTAHCGMTRMALVPRVLEARGLDVSPGMIARLDGAGDEATADILRVILREEERHVEIGTRWFHYLCDRNGAGDPDKVFLELIDREFAAVRPPLNHPARRRAGFSADELAGLERRF